MLTVLLVIQTIIAIAMITVILLQRSSTDGLAGLSGGGSGDSILSGRASANLMTKTTAILATAFMINSLLMATITARSSSLVGDSLVDNISAESPLITNTPPSDLAPTDGGTAQTQEEQPQQNSTVPIAD